MSDTERVESARASREAREAVAQAAARRSTTDAVDAALKRYLAAEQYHAGRDAEPPHEDERHDT